MVEAKNELPYCLSQLGLSSCLFAICFCIPSYVRQQLLSLYCQNFVHYNSQCLQCFLSILGTLLVQGFIFGRGPTICIGVCTLKCTEKLFISFTPSIFSLSLSHIQNLKEALNMPAEMYCTIHLLEIMRLSAFKSPLFYPSS
jgi:hypothetical protein